MVRVTSSTSEQHTPDKCSNVWPFCRQRLLILLQVVFLDQFHFKSMPELWDSVLSIVVCPFVCEKCVALCGGEWERKHMMMPMLGGPSLFHACGLMASVVVVICTVSVLAVVVHHLRTLEFGLLGCTTFLPRSRLLFANALHGPMR